MLNRYRVIGGVLIAILVLAVAPTVFGAFTPEVFVIDQPSVDSTVNVTRATIDAPGWVVIHADEDGAPGPEEGAHDVARAERFFPRREHDEQARERHEHRGERTKARRLP